MTISNNTVLQKMMKELQEAQIQQQHNQDITIHISKIYMLCELLLDKQESGSPLDATQQEQIAMFGEIRASKEDKHEKIDHEDANGDSIFDF
ncbi:YwdI family protein [Ornithinibacillus sp. 4-3]|uniref:YwdI family protein n=1 Tax=Ornithinibacillus sp. 4-3 TaxID=3231488 RepID=A0AB39HQC2_9BACI